jgi:hypothetical protein
MLHIKYPLPVESVAWRSMARGTVEIDHDRCFSRRFVHFVNATAIDANSAYMGLWCSGTFGGVKALRTHPRSSEHVTGCPIPNVDDLSILVCPIRCKQLVSAAYQSSGLVIE